MKQYRKAATRIYERLEQAMKQRRGKDGKEEEEDDDLDEFASLLTSQFRQESIEKEQGMSNSLQRRRVHPAEQAFQDGSSQVKLIQDISIKENMRTYFQWLERHLNKDELCTVQVTCRLMFDANQHVKLCVILTPTSSSSSYSPRAPPPALRAVSVSTLPVAPVVSYCETPRLLPTQPVVYSAYPEETSTTHAPEYEGTFLVITEEGEEEEYIAIEPGGE
jgi:hypothetical protein